MNKILNLNQLEDFAQELHNQNKKIVLAGGCFDILHPGHLFFLEEAKKSGDVLFLLLESDESIKTRKGIDRPINSQKNRAVVLSTLSSVDYIIPLVGMTKDGEYDKLIVQTRPDVIALTIGDPGIEKRRKQCELVGAKLKLVKNIRDLSTTNLLR